MKYIINDNIFFDTLTGRLYPIGEESSAIQLSRPSGLLLEELVINAGKTSTRDVLLTHVWEKNGLIPSGNNLSNHISYLRKTFRKLGLSENSIVTVPKEGFRLNIHVRSYSVPSPAHTDLPETACTRSDQKNPAGSKKNPFFAPGRMPGISIIAILLFLTLFFVIISLSRQTASTQQRLSSAFGNCELHDLNPGVGMDEREKRNRLTGFIKSKKIDCKKIKSTIYFNFFNFTSEETHQQRVLFLAHCETGSTSREYCTNYLSVTLKTP